MTTTASFRGFMPMVFAVASCACGSSSNTYNNTYPDGGYPEADGGTTTTDGGAATTDGGAASNQTPPTNDDDMDAWLETGVYKDWHCESAVHAARAPSPHGFTRICSNDAIANNARGNGAWPRGAAAVKEMYASENSKDPDAYAVYLKTADDSADGANWYWYGHVSIGSPEVDGMGDSGPASSMCVSCHAGAARDFVWTSVHEP